MTAARAAAVAGLLLLAVGVQTALLGRLPVPGPMPDLVLLVVIGVALTAGANAGAITGFAAGLLIALAPPAAAPLGLAAVLYAIVGFQVGARAAGERLARGSLAGIAAIAGAAVSVVSTIVLALWGQGWPGIPALLLGAALQAGYCALLAVVVTPAVSAAVAAVPGRG
jgi:rod shape-determining protein MreD